MKRTVSVLIILVCATGYIHAQEQTTLSMNLHVVSPEGAFRQNVDRLGVGIQFAGSYRFDRSPFSLGAEFAFHNYGVDSREE